MKMLAVDLQKLSLTYYTHHLREQIHDDVQPHTVAQLDELVRLRSFPDRREAIIVAIERLYTAAVTPRRRRQQALARLCGALSLGTTRQSLHQAAVDRLAWESAER
jgi:hypothetical protein